MEEQITAEEARDAVRSYNNNLRDDTLKELYKLIRDESLLGGTFISHNLSDMYVRKMVVSSLRTLGYDVHVDATFVNISWKLEEEG